MASVFGRDPEEAVPSVGNGIPEIVVVNNSTVCGCLGGRNLKLGAILAAVIFVVSGIFASLGHSKIAPFSGMPFSVKVTLATVALVGGITATALLILSRRHGDPSKSQA